LNKIDIKPNYLWEETKAILSGGNSLTLTNTIGINHKLVIKDTKYGSEWFKDIHWTRSGQTITLTESSLSEDLTFVITNFG